MDDVLFTEELTFDESDMSSILKSQSKSLSIDQLKKIKSTVIINRPRWREITHDYDQILESGRKSRFIYVRLGFQFKTISIANKLIFARCSNCIEAVLKGQTHPTVYDLYPRDLYEGKARTIKVTVNPKFTLNGYSVEGLKAESDFSLGTIEPAVVGWPGEEERFPYWEFRPQSRSLLGVKHLWLIIDIPEGCTSFRLRMQAEVTVQTKFGLIPLRPKKRFWEDRPSELFKL